MVRSEKWFFKSYSSTYFLGPTSLFQRGVRTREPLKLPAFFFIKAAEPVLQISIIIQSPNIPGSENKCYREVIGEQSGEPAMLGSTTH